MPAIRQAVTVRFFTDGNFNEEHIEERLVYTGRDGRAYIRTSTGKVYLTTSNPPVLERRAITITPTTFSDVIKRASASNAAVVVTSSTY
jgi:hypothetical protein